MLPNNINHKWIASASVMNASYENQQRLSSHQNDAANEFNLIDLDCINKTQHDNKEKQLDNLQMKMLEEFLKTSKPIKPAEVCLTSEEEFQKFFDKCEFNKPEPVYKLTNTDIRTFETEFNHVSVDDQEQINKSNHDKRNNSPFKDKFAEFNELKATVNDLNCLDDMSPKLSVPTDLQPEKETSDKEVLDLDDLIEELMIEKNLEKQRLEKAHNKELEQKISAEKLKTDENAELHKVSTVLNNPYNQSKIFDEIITKNLKHFRAPRNITEIKPQHVSDNAKVYETKVKLEQKALTEELVTKYDVKYLETVKKIDKVFLKRSNLKTDVEKSKLTKGPSLYEKTVVLPQIMQRLNARDKEMEDLNMMQMRLILDAGPSRAMVQIPCNNSHSTEKCATKTIKKSKNIHNALYTNASMLNTPKVLDSQNPKVLNAPKVLDSQNPKVLSAPKVLDFQKPKVLNTPKAMNSQNLNVLNTPKVENSQNPNELNPPEVLMADCNKERLNAFIAGKLYECFVHGQY